MTSTFRGRHPKELVSPPIDKTKILILPDEYMNKNQGGIPARNFIWEHSSKNGHKKHWILDDNIDGFYRWNYTAPLISNQQVYLGIARTVLDSSHSSMSDLLNLK